MICDTIMLGCLDRPLPEPPSYPTLHRVKGGVRGSSSLDRTGVQIAGSLFLDSQVGQLKEQGELDETVASKTRERPVAHHLVHSNSFLSHVCMLALPKGSCQLFIGCFVNDDIHAQNRAYPLRQFHPTFYIKRLLPSFPFTPEKYL